MDFSQHFNQVHLSDVTLRLKTTVDAMAQSQEDEDLASNIRKRARQPDEDAHPCTGNGRSYFLHKIILCQSPYFKNKLKYEEDDTLGVKPPNEKRARNSSASNDLAASTSSVQVEHVEECELEAMELLLKSFYKADLELTEEARGNGHLLLQVSLSGD